MVGHRDRAEALLARAREQHLDRRGAVVGVVGVHVQVDVDQRPRRQPLAQRRSPVGGVAAGGERRGRSARAHRRRRRRRARAGSRRGSGVPSARPSRAGSPCARRGGRRSSRRSGARRASRAGARWRSGRSRRSARASGAARRWRCSARTARARGRSRAATVLSSSSTVRATSIGSADGRRRLARRAWRHGSRAPRRRRSRAACRASVPSSSALAPFAPARAARSALRDARTRSCEREGASTSTRCPRRESSAATRSTCRVDLVVLRLPRVRRDVGYREARRPSAPRLCPPPIERARAYDAATRRLQLASSARASRCARLSRPLRGARRRLSRACRGVRRSSR